MARGLRLVNARLMAGCPSRLACRTDDSNDITRNRLDMIQPPTLDDPRCHDRERRAKRDRALLEIGIVLVIVGLMTLLHQSRFGTFAILNMFFLPVTLAGFFLGRYRACTTALLCVLAAAVVLWYRADLTEWLGLWVWAGVIGLQSLVIGTLSDDHQREVVRLREMHRTDTLSDALTGVANRRAFDYELDRRLSEWNRYRVPLSLLLLDIDHFKRLNDTYGHTSGDVVLREVAQRIAADCRETDLVARYGGEEFAVVMPNTPSSEAMKVAERIRCTIEASRVHIDDCGLRVTISLGLSQIMRGEDRTSLVQRADAALYMSKQEGRNCSHFHDGHQTEAFGVVAARSGAKRSVVKNSVVAPDAYSDALTGLPSRRVFVDELRRRLSESSRYDRSLAMMIVQLDQISAETEVDADDRIAMNSVVAEQARLVMRDADLVARFDEDQFAILLPSTTEGDAITPAVRLCERVFQSRSLPETSAGRQISVSIGIGGLMDETDTVATLVQRVQEALWAAVRDGGNRVFCHDGTQVVPATAGGRAELRATT